MALSDGLQRYYPLNGNGTDVHGGVNAAITGPSPAWATGHVSAQALDISGNSSNKCRANVFTDSEFTCQFWMKRTGNTTSTYFGVVGNMRVGAVTDNWFFLGANVACEWYTLDNSPRSRLFSPPLGTWTHVVVSQSATRAKVHVDGVEIVNLAVTPVAVVSAVDFLIGCRNDGYGNFPALFQEVALWNRALSTAEITELYNGGAGRGYSYIAAAAPTVTSVAPATGAGGTAVTITGTGFVSGATVAFDGIPATSVVFVSGTSLTCVAPAHAAGAVNVVVRNPDLQTGTAINAFTYSADLTSAAGSRLLDLLPPGRLWELEAGSTLHRLMVGVGDEVDRVITRARDLFEETDPRSATETIGDWERVLALPDEQVIAIPATLAQRRVAVTQKLVGRTGQNLSFFTALCAACGYPVNQIERFATSMLRVNGRVGARVYGEAWAYTMRITLNAPTAGALSVADFERVVRHATHAHIVVVFIYL